MSADTIEHDLTLWMVNDVPARMFYASQRWKVTDTPTRLRESVWAVPLEESPGLYGWRFQATAPGGESFVFDVYRGQNDWQVHRAYA
jgi:hypothetical protein